MVEAQSQMMSGRPASSSRKKHDLSRSDWRRALPFVVLVALFHDNHHFLPLLRALSAPCLRLQRGVLDFLRVDL